jgi:general secretion pathway protein M
MRQWWESLAERERLLLSVGVLVLALLLAYLFVVEPLQSELKTATAERDAKTALFHKLQGAAAEADALRAQQVVAGSLPDGADARSLVQQSAEAAGLKEQMRNVGSGDAGTVKLGLEQAQFDTALLWLVTLRQQYGLRVEAFSATRGGEPGTADIDVTLGVP